MSEAPAILDFPWPYSIRRSLKARHLRITLCPVKGVVVVYPRWSNRAEAYQFMLSHHDWVLARSQVFSDLMSPRRYAIPSEIALPALGYTVRCQWVSDSRSSRNRLHSDASGIMLSGESQDITSYLPQCRHWLKRRALEVLQPRLLCLSDEIGLAFSKVSWRFQKTLWGSCNRQQALSLNVKLLFLSPPIVRYVMIHELCHTRYFSHGPRFWSLVEHFDPCFRQHEAVLKRGTWDFPSWVNLL